MLQLLLSILLVYSFKKTHIAIEIQSLVPFHPGPLCKISLQSAHNVLNTDAYRQANKQTNKQADRQTNQRYLKQTPLQRV